MQYQVTKESFLKDVENHKATIILDSKIHRHIHCTSGSSCYHFDIVTYPGHLVVSGDMGDFVFQRTVDMFEFFRPNNTYLEDKWIDVGYWGGKLQASSVRGQSKFEVFDGDLIIPSVMEHLEEYCEDLDYKFDIYLDENSNPEYKDIESFTSAFKKEVKDYFDYHEEELNWQQYASVFEGFDSEIIDDNDFLCEWYEWVETDKASDNYLWCCYAIVWAIKQYDEIKANK